MMFFIIILGVYLAISVAIAIYRIRMRWKYEFYMMMIPIGDTCFHAPKNPLLDEVTTIFFPAQIIIRIWTSITKSINSHL